MTEPTASVTLTCACNRSITVALLPEPCGHGYALDLPDDWRAWHVDDTVVPECPEHVRL